MLTTAPSDRSVDLLSWALRAAAVGGAMVFLLARFGAVPDWTVLAGVALLESIGLAWAARSIRRAGIPLGGRAMTVRLVVMALLAPLLVLATFPDAGWVPGDLPLVFAVGFQLLMPIMFGGLSRFLLVRGHAWWFDKAAQAPGAWVSLLVRRNRRADVIAVDRRLGRFPSEEDAAEWLEDNGYVPAERALAEHLVDSVPPDVLPAARRHRQLRVAQSEPGVRVKAHTSGEAVTNADDDAVDELAESSVSDSLDTPEPTRALAVEKPREK
jgi:hypothetical protein